MENQVNSNNAKILKYEKYQMVFKLDSENMILLSCDLSCFDDDLYIQDSEGIVKELNKELFDGVESFYSISLSEYGVELTEEELIDFEV